MPTGPRGLLPFGARFVEQSEAAAAADLALIAMWGFSAAAPFLNGPVELYSQKNEVVGRLFGSDLSSYLLSICEISKSAKRKRTKLASGKTSEISRSEKLRKIKTDHCLVDEREPCGLCPACLFPFLNKKCYRKQLASKLNYKVEKVAANILNSAPPGTSNDFNNLDGFPQEDPRGEAIQGDDGISTAVTWLIEEINNKKLQEKKHLSLEWLDHPKARLGEARKHHADWVVGELHTRQSQADNEDAQSLSTFIDMLRSSSMPTALAKAPDPTDILSPPEHKEIFDHALMCMLLDADVSLVDEDDERFAAPLGESAIPPCMLCRGSHPKRNGYLECPVMRIAYATQSNTSRSCEKNSRRSLPEFVWTPAFISTPWVSSVAPETLYLMECLKELGNAAATDFDRPDVAGKLGPHALLALGLLGEELASAQLRMG